MILVFPNMSKTKQYHAAFALILSFPPATAFAQDATSIARIQDHRRMAQEKAFVFVGEIAKMRSIPRPICKAGASVYRYLG